MNNIVIGSEGFVGQPLCRFLEEQGERVIPFDVKRDADKEDARFVELPLDGVDRCYFLAWEVGGAKYLYREDAQYRQLDWNLQLMLNVMPQLQKHNIPFLFVSSQLAEENDTVYGVTKRLGEVWTNLLKGVRVRLWNVYGPAEKTTERSHVVADFVYQALTDGSIHMLTTGEETRQFIHVDDVCSAFHMALSKDLDEVCDVSSFEWVKVVDVANIIAGITRAKVVRGEIVGSNPVTPMKGKIPGWHPNVRLEDGLARCVELARISLGSELQKAA